MKMVYKEIKGDLIELALKDEFDFIAHGCNCHKSMGAGIAAAISKLIPEASAADRLDQRLPIERLGDMSMFDRKNGKCVVINLYTQFDGGKNLDYEALILCLRKVNIMFSGCTIGLPMIGCGIAGGDWVKVRRIIKRELKGMKSVTIVML